MSAVALEALRRRLPRVLLISDDLQMRGLQAVLDTETACLEGLRAGLDLLLIGNNLLDEAGAAERFVRSVSAAAERDPPLARRLAQALARVRERKRLLHGGPPGP
jgi:beta-N-acetylhexosaminidase